MKYEDFFGFVRLRICLFLTSIGVIGYLLLNSVSSQLIFVVLSCFFAVAGAYAYNNMTDKEEDLVNRKGFNPFVLKKGSYLIIALFFLVGFYFSTFLSFISVTFYLLGVLVSVIYSFFKLKKYFLVKNIYSGFGVSLVFLLGASSIAYETVEYYILISFFIFIASLISDLRDYEGDRLSNIRTLPVSLGYDNCKKLVFAFLSLFSFTILFFSGFIILLPFTMVMIYFLIKNKPTLAHSCEGLSFVFLAIWLVVGI